MSDEITVSVEVPTAETPAAETPAVAVITTPAQGTDSAFLLGQLTEQMAAIQTEVQSIREQISSAAATAEVALSEAAAARSEAEAVTAAEVATVEEVEITPPAIPQADGAAGDGPPAPRTRGKLAAILFGK